jgi:hypothetical protein
LFTITVIGKCKMTGEARRTERNWGFLLFLGLRWVVWMRYDDVDDRAGNGWSGWRMVCVRARAADLVIVGGRQLSKGIDLLFVLASWMNE